MTIELTSLFPVRHQYLKWPFILTYIGICRGFPYHVGIYVETKRRLYSFRAYVTAFRAHVTDSFSRLVLAGARGSINCRDAIAGDIAQGAVSRWNTAVTKRGYFTADSRLTGCVKAFFALKKKSERNPV